MVSYYLVGRRYGCA